MCEGGKPDEPTTRWGIRTSARRSGGRSVETERGRRVVQARRTESRSKAWVSSRRLAESVPSGLGFLKQQSRQSRTSAQRHPSNLAHRDTGRSAARRRGRPGRRRRSLSGGRRTGSRGHRAGREAGPTGRGRGRGRASGRGSGRGGGSDNARRGRGRIGRGARGVGARRAGSGAAGRSYQSSRYQHQIVAGRERKVSQEAVVASPTSWPVPHPTFCPLTRLYACAPSAKPCLRQGGQDRRRTVC